VNDPSVLKALTRETKALIIVSEFEAQRMPMFQLRGVLEAVVKDDAERKVIIDLVENDLRATGYPQEQIASFLTELLAHVKPKTSIDQQILATRKLRSPFAASFDAGPAPQPPPDTAFPRPPAVSPGGIRPPVPGVTAPPIPGPRPSSFIPQPPPGLPPRDEPPPPQTAPSLPTLPPVSSPRAGTPSAGTSGQRRSTLVFEAVPKTGSNTGLPAVTPPTASPIPPPSGAGVTPASERTTARHEMMFSNLASQTAAPLTYVGEPAAAPAAPSGKPKPVILLADDDRRARMVFRMRLEEAGMSPIEVGTGTEAWEKIQQGGLSAAVLDMKMPGLHGLEVLSHMADKGIQLPVVVCTAYDQLEDEFVVQTHPRLKYLVKPIAPETMIRALRELLGLDF